MRRALDQQIGKDLRRRLERMPGSLNVKFIVTDYTSELSVVYDRLLPDLFKEGTGVWANGRLDKPGVLVADEVIAKHDENYMPAVYGEALKKGESRLDAQPATDPNGTRRT